MEQAYDDLLVLGASFDGALPLGSVVPLTNLRGVLLFHHVLQVFLKPLQRTTAKKPLPSANVS